MYVCVHTFLLSFCHVCLFCFFLSASLCVSLLCTCLHLFVSLLIPLLGQGLIYAPRGYQVY